MYNEGDTVKINVPDDPEIDGCYARVEYVYEGGTEGYECRFMHAFEQLSYSLVFYEDELVPVFCEKRIARVTRELSLA